VLRCCLRMQVVICLLLKKTVPVMRYLQVSPEARDSSRCFGPCFGFCTCGYVLSGRVGMAAAHGGSE
jgi:hypothetical protein